MREAALGGIIDFHVHITRSSDDCGRILEAASRCGISLICASSLGDEGYIPDPTPDQFRSANNYVLESMRRFPGRVIGFCYLNPNYPGESVEEMERCAAEGMRGVKLWIACRASDPKLEPVVSRAIELDLPILIHSFDKTTGNLPGESRPEDIADLAARFPRAKIVMAHLHGNGFRGVAEVAGLKNVSVDLSGSDPEVGLVEYALEELGADRLIFGSDAPGRDFPSQLGKVLGAEMTDEERRKVLALNAARLLKLDPGDLKLPTPPCPLSGAVDVNACLGEHLLCDLHPAAAPELLSLMEGYGISEAWVSPIKAIFEVDPRRSNRRLAAEISGYPALKLAAVMNPSLSSWRRAFEEALRIGAVALKLYPNYHRYSPLSPRALELLREAGRAGIPVIIQLRVQDERTQNPLMSVRDVDLGEVIEAARRVAETKVIIGGIRWTELVKAAPLIKKMPNLWVEISALERMNGLREAIGMIGAEKLLFGTHAPFFYIASAALKLSMADIDEGARRRIAIENPRRLREDSHG